MTRRIVALFVIVAAVSSPRFAIANQAIDRLSGFDADRVTTAASWVDNPADMGQIAEVAKLVYQVNRAAGTFSLLSNNASPLSSSSVVGEVVRIRGRVTKIDRIAVPATLAEVLEFSALYRVEVQAEEPAKSLVIIASRVPRAWTQKDSPANLGFATAATGVLSRSATATTPTVIVAESLAWLAGPEAAGAVPTDWLLLSERGFDLSLFDGVKDRNRQPLKTDDAAAFYSLLRIADEFDGTQASIQPATESADKMLRDSVSLVGRYVRVPLQTVRVTKVMVTQPGSRERLGGDHYWQIDAIGDLGNTIIKIERSAGDEGVTFENRYPVSVVAKRLPEFLTRQINAAAGGTEIDVAMVATQVVVDGFFFRLWSYDSDFMDRNGGGKQFGPLLIASQMVDAEPPPGDTIGVSRLGWYVAGVMILGIFGVAISSIRAARGEAAEKRQQRATIPKTFD